ncbi:MAG: ATP-binding protein [Candidatus Kapaibacterium sp.]
MIDKKELRHKAEELFRQENINIRDLTPVEIKTLVEELSIHKIELELQNTELQSIQHLLDEEKQKFSDLYNDAPIAYLTLDKEGDILEINNTGKQFLGLYEPPGATGLFKFVHPEDQDDYHFFINALMESDKKLTADLRLINNTNKQFRWSRIDGKTVFKNNSPVFIKLLIKDIDDVKKAENKVEEKNRFLNNILESLTHPFFVINAKNHKIEMANSASKKYTKELNSFCYIITGNEQAPCKRKEYDCPVELVKSTGKPATVNHKNYDKEANELTYEIHAYPVFSESGEIEKIIEYTIDITSKYDADKKLIQYRLMLESVLEAIPVRVFWKDKDLNYLGCNKLFYMDAGLNSSDAVIGKSDHELPWKVFADDFRKQDAEVISTGKSKLNYEEKVSIIDGSQIDVRTSKVPLRDQEGNILGVLGIYVDITDLKKYQSDIQKLNSELETRVRERTYLMEDALNELKSEIERRKTIEEELSRAKSKLEGSLNIQKRLNDMRSNFVSMVSHEYRNPLTMILSSIYLLKRFHETGDEAEFNSHLDKIRSAVNSMNSMLNDIILLGKAESSDLKIVKKQIDLKEYITLIASETRYLFKNSHDITLETIGDSFIINADDSLLQHVINNLISNAIKYSPDKSTVRIKIKEKNENIILAIKDEGIGIKPEEQEYLFEQFYRGSNTRDKTGTGLGLYIVKTFVERMKGTIKVESSLGLGSEFKVILPKQ